MARKAGTGNGQLRLAARLLLRPNELRRPIDRVETVIVVGLSAVFLAALAAAPYLGIRIYRWQHSYDAHLRPSVAVLSQRGPAGGYLAGSGLAAARWKLPDGHWRSGTVTMETAPGIAAAPVGARVPVWLTSSGEPTNPPGSLAGEILTAAGLVFSAACGAGLILTVCYWLCRLTLDRQRLAAWESAWARAGPRWSSRRE